MMAAEPRRASAVRAETRFLARYLYASVAVAVATIVLKTAAAAITGSVAFLSDALESGVNLVAAIVALVALFVAAKPPDTEHDFGHGKAEYLSAASEAAMIFVAGGLIAWTAVGRIFDPTPIDQPAVGLGLSIVAALLNLAVGAALLRAGRRHRSMVLIADGKHLLTDVWTSAGIVVGIALVAIFDWDVLDPLVALLVGVNILRTGYQILRRSLIGLLDAALPAEDLERADAVLERFRSQVGVDFEPLRTRESGRQRFVYVTMTVPGDWSVRRSHDITEDLELEMDRALPGALTFVHVEPGGDPRRRPEPGTEHRPSPQRGNPDRGVRIGRRSRSWYSRSPRGLRRRRRHPVAGGALVFLQKSVA